MHIILRLQQNHQIIIINILVQAKKLCIWHYFLKITEPLIQWSVLQFCVFGPVVLLVLRAKKDASHRYTHPGGRNASLAVLLKPHFYLWSINYAKVLVEIRVVSFYLSSCHSLWKLMQVSKLQSWSRIPPSLKKLSLFLRLWLIGWGPPTLCRVICFSQSQLV